MGAGAVGGAEAGAGAALACDPVAVPVAEVDVVAVAVAVAVAARAGVAGVAALPRRGALLNDDGEVAGAAAGGAPL